MRHACARGVLGLALVAALAATVVVAPVASAKKASPERSNLVKAVGTASFQAKKLITASRSCPAAARQRTITSQVRTAQTKRLAKAGATSLRLRQFRISTHTRRLAVALTKCSRVATGPGASGPGTRVLQPTNGNNGNNGGDGTQSAQVPLNALGDMLDVGGLLNGGVLPGVIPTVDIASLGVDPACVVAGSACVGVDTGALANALTDTVRAQTQQLPLLAGVLDPLLAQVQATLASTGPDSLLTVQRASDSTLVVTAKAGSALASLLNVLGTTGVLPTTPFATVQIR
jgi:hypothetical protein